MTDKPGRLYSMKLSQMCRMLKLEVASWKTSLEKLFPSPLLGLLRLQLFAEETRCVAFLAFCHFLRSTTGKKASTCIAAFGTEVDDMVGTLDDLEVVLNDDNCMTTTDESVEGCKQLLDVVEVKAGRGFVEDENG